MLNRRFESLQAQGDGETRKSPWVWLTPLAMLAVLVLLYFVWPAYQTFVKEAYSVVSSGRQERIQSWVSSFGAWSYVVILGLMLFQTLVAFLPSVALMIVAVVSFGAFVGGLIAWGGLLLAACLGYAIGRSFGVVTVDRLIGSDTEQKLERIIDRYGIWAVVAARISPVLSTDAVSIGAGVVKMHFLPFIAATAAGTLPLAILIAWLGEDFSRLKSGLIWISVVSLVIFAGYVIYDRWKGAPASDG